MSRSRRLGTTWETAVVTWLRDYWPNAERRALNGAKDRGDIAGIPLVVIECKNAKTITLAAWLDELAAEMANDTAEVGALWVKRRGKASAGDGYIVLHPTVLVRLLKGAGY